jgi:splicing factor 45
VLYDRPAAEKKKNAGSNEERPAKKQKINEPKKPSKAELMMAKMGYKKGQGLGKNSDGVTTHLEVKARKDQGPRTTRDELDEDSGSKGFKTQQVFDITGGLRKQGPDHGRFGEPSKVIVAVGCLDGVDMAKDQERDDGGIRQEIGDTFNQKVCLI